MWHKQFVIKSDVQYFIIPKKWTLYVIQFSNIFSMVNFVVF